MSDDAEPVIPLYVLERCVDPDLPKGVVEFRFADGRRFRFPLIEFMVDDE